MNNLSSKVQSLLESIRSRRSRRFGVGMEIPSGPLAFKSDRSPSPLSEIEEAVLVYAACGLTANALGDLSYGPGEGGNIVTGLHGRTIASGDGIQSVALAVINDSSCSVVKRSRDFEPRALQEIIELGNSGQLTEVYRRMRTQFSDERRAPSTDPIENININKWAVQAPGTSYFLPINDLTILYINGLLEIFNESTGVFAVDERRSYLPAGLGAFARSKGGHLDDDPRLGKMVTIRHVETLVSEFVAIEQGMMLQNLALATEALGLGGYPNFANHEFAWFEALGFRMGAMPASRYLGCGPIIRTALRLMKKDPVVPYPLGLEMGDQMLLKSYCPPYFRSMSDAVQAVVDLKFKQSEGFRPLRWHSTLKRPEAAALEVAPLSEKAIAATKAYCEYVWGRYGRFPAHLAPFRTIMGFQVAHLDKSFYDHHYKPGVLTELQERDFAALARK